MTNNFDLALADLGLSAFGDDNFCRYTLLREDKSEIDVSLYRDTKQQMLRMSAFTTNFVPFSISRQFFSQFAEAALEPFRDGVGIGMAEGTDRVCVYYNLPMKNYLAGNSVLVMEEILDQVEKFDEILPVAAV